MMQRPRFPVGLSIWFGLASALFLLIIMGVTPAISAAEDPSSALACPDCNDGNGCTVDACDTATGTCRHDPLVCADDGNSCTTERCFPGPFGSPSCDSIPAADGTACNDGDPCTAGDRCASSLCIGQAMSAGAACDDGDPCTKDEICDIRGNCTGAPLAIGATCDDGDLCTTGEVCAEGADGSVRCAGTPRSCSDGDLCTSDVCDPVTGLCRFPPVDCQDGNACTTDSCDPATGACRRDNIPGACDDGNGCTVGDSCQGGNCVPTGPRDCSDLPCGRATCIPFEPPYCHYFLDQNLCPQGGTCTVSLCTVPGYCIPTSVPGDCTPPGSCTLSQCVRGGCLGVFTIPCNDNNSCTDDTCPNRACSHSPRPDGEACATVAGVCVTGSACAAGVCAGGQPLNCDDGDPCTADNCDPSAGCVHTPLTCDDGNDCTQDFCAAPSGECRHTPLGGTRCDDHNNCTRVDSCVNGQCVGTGAVDCDDHNLCTDDLCNTAGGCYHQSVVCDRGNPCEVGTCQHAGIGCQYHPSLESDCDDLNACTVNDLCTLDSAGHAACRGTSIAVPCDDGNPCTDDLTDPATCQCSHTPNNRPCDDGDPCTTGDTCALGSCHAGAVDENRLEAFCTPSPATLRLGTGGSPFTMSCTIRQGCGAGGGTTIRPGSIGRTWISRADALHDATDDRTYPDPGSLPCPDPSPGSSSERGISENLMDRKSHGDVVTFKFNLPSDGQCATLDGDRQSLMERVALVPDGEAAQVCVAGLRQGVPFEGCATVIVRGGAHPAAAPPPKTHRVHQRP